MSRRLTRLIPFDALLRKRAALKKILKATRFNIYADTCDVLLRELYGITPDPEKLFRALCLSCGSTDRALTAYLAIGPLDK